MRSLGGILGPLGRIFGGVLERLGQFGPVAGGRRRSAGADTQGPLFRILQDFPRMLLCKSFVYPEKRRFGRIREGKEGEKKVRVWDFIRHAQAQGLARRIQRAAELRTRHRA